MASRQEALVESVAGVYRELEQTLDSMTEEDLARASSNEGWSGQDTLAHLATIEERTRGQMRCAIEGGQWNPTETIDEYNERQVAARRGWSLQKLREEMKQQHDETLSLLRSASDADLDKTFVHPRRGTLSLAGLMESSLNHVRTHSAEIAAVKAK
jgi:uncharacterized protein (TIGR03083 family)